LWSSAVAETDRADDPGGRLVEIWLQSTSYLTVAV